MTTSTPIIPLETDGRTVREVVESNHELVNEIWCRRIIRQLLQSLELQYAMQMPHRHIDPDTVLVLESGDPMLLPSTDSSSSSGSEAGDMHDLAAVIHFAITQEAPPRAPLHGRAPGDFSDAFVRAIDRCLSPDPAQRPRNVEELRNLLGIVPLGAAPPQPAAPVMAEPAPGLIEPPPAVPTKGPRRWPLLLAALVILLCAAAGLVALLQQADTGDTPALALPEAVPEHAATVEPITAPAAVAGASYKLVIKPWGMVHVDGVEHGASPPLKRLQLAPGEHTIVIKNPNFPEHTVTVNAAEGASSTIELDFSEETVE